MKFDEQGHIVWTPKELYQMVLDHPRRLVNGYLMTGTPWAFAEYRRYVEFIEAVAERTGIHPRNLYLRGSCQISFSIAPRDKVWTAMSDQSDLDLVIVDGSYFERFDQEVRRWDARNPAEFLQGKASEALFDRQRDRQFNCCRDTGLPSVVCVHHRDTMLTVSAMAHCGCIRRLSAFVYPDWHSARRRYENDLRLLREGIEAGRLPPPGDAPLVAVSRRQLDQPLAAPPGA
jgi:hypothetical protein